MFSFLSRRRPSLIRHWLMMFRHTFLHYWSLMFFSLLDTSLILLACHDSHTATLRCHYPMLYFRWAYWAGHICWCCRPYWFISGRWPAIDIHTPLPDSWLMIGWCVITPGYHIAWQPHNIFIFAVIAFDWWPAGDASLEGTPLSVVSQSVSHCRRLFSHRLILLPSCRHADNTRSLAVLIH